LQTGYLVRKVFYNPLPMYLYPSANPSDAAQPHQAAYFYMPANDGRPAELIEILNCSRTYIHVPMREEDVMLDAFFVRDMTEVEIQNFSDAQVWQIFGSWDELLEDHHRYKVENHVVSILMRFKDQYPLPEGMAA
jgi:hypothetical protein